MGFARSVPSITSPLTFGSHLQSRRQTDMAVILFCIIGTLAIGLGLYYALRNSNDSQSNKSPQNPNPILPPVCQISSSSSHSSAVPISPHQFLTSAHAVTHREQLTITCNDQAHTGVALCDLEQTGFCRIISQNHFDVLPASTTAAFKELQTGMLVKVSGCPDGDLESCFGHISELNAFSQTLRITPQNPYAIRVGFSGGRVDVRINDTWYFCGLVEACGSQNGFTCATSILVIHPDSIGYTDPRDNLLLQRLTLEALNIIPNRFSSPISNTMKTQLQIAVANMNTGDLFPKSGKTVVTVDDKYIIKNPTTQQSSGIRIDFQGSTTNRTYRNFQAQVNGVKGHSTIAAVLVPTAFDLYPEGFGRYLERRFRAAILESFATGQIIELKKT